MRPVYLVLGMHRSGTSALTELLGAAGLTLPTNLIPADAHNPKGYFEPWRIAILNDERLQAAKSAWDDVFAFAFPALPRRAERRWLSRAEALFEEEYGAADLPVLKDPRITVLLPFWRELFEDLDRQPLCIVLVRSPLAVAASLARRDGFTLEKSLALWTGYMLAAEAHTRDLPRVFVDYDRLLADWRTEVARIETAHGRRLPGVSDRALRRMDRVLDPKLRRSAPEGALEGFGWAGEAARVVHRELGNLCADGAADPAALGWATDQLERRRRDFGAISSPACADLDRLRHAVRHADGRVDVVRHELRREIAALKSALREAREEVAGRDRELAVFYESLQDAERALDAALAKP